MTRPVNKYQEFIDNIPPAGIINLEGYGLLELGAKAFEEGVDAGRKWGREEKDEEWRDAIHRALRNHTEQFVYGHERIIPAEHIEALL